MIHKPIPLTVKYKQSYIRNIRSMVQSLKEMDAEFSNFTVSNKTVPLIRSKIAHAVFLSNIQQCAAQNHTDFHVTDHRSCDFGKFYYSEGAELYSEYPEFKEIEPIHAKVHEFGKEVIDTVKSPDLNMRKDAYEGFQNTVSEFLTSSRPEKGVFGGNRSAYARPAVQDCGSKRSADEGFVACYGFAGVCTRSRIASENSFIVSIKRSFQMETY